MVSKPNINMCEKDFGRNLGLPHLVNVFLYLSPSATSLLSS